MSRPSFQTLLRASLITATAVQLSGCASTSSTGYVAMEDRECLARVMYFESLRSSEDGMLAVGSVVMNRLESGRYPNSVCGVIGQRSQFAPGALTRPMDGRGAALAYKVAGNVLAGQRHPGLPKAVMFFHTYGYRYPYTNMRYVLVAGGNIFYYKDNGSYAGYSGAAAVASSYAAATSGTVSRLAYAPDLPVQTMPQPIAAPPDATTRLASSEAVNEVPVPRAQPPAEAAPTDPAPTAATADSNSATAEPQGAQDAGPSQNALPSGD